MFKLLLLLLLLLFFLFFFRELSSDEIQNDAGKCNTCSDKKAT